ncbi:hypothetical protein [Halorientalis persicus]|nr:hypothetical protein [Halorientalis persicus]
MSTRGATRSSRMASTTAAGALAPGRAAGVGRGANPWFDVTVVEERPGSSLADLARSAMLERVLGTDAEGVTRFRTPALSVSVVEDASATFSLDGELRTASAVHLRTDPGTVRLPVGPTYRPDPATD